MKYLKYLILCLFVFILSFILLLSRNITSQEIEVESTGEENKVYLTGIFGDVEVGKIGGLDKADLEEPHSKLGEGWFVKTRESSSAILYINDLVVKVNQNSKLEITQTDRKTIRLNFKYGSIKIDSRQFYEEKNVIVDTESNTIKNEEASTFFELTFDDEKKDLDYDVNEGTISITTDDVKIYVDNKGVIKEEKVDTEPKENNNNESVTVNDNEDDYEPIDYNNEDNNNDSESVTISDNEDDYEPIDYNNENNNNNDSESVTINDNGDDYETNTNVEDDIENVFIDDDEEEEEEEEEEPESISDIIDEEALDELEDKGMTINKGTDPPDIEGEYLVDDLYIVYDSKQPPHYFDPGYAIEDYIYTFYDQLPDLSLKGAYKVINNPKIYGQGNAAFISGKGDDFTIYLRTESRVTGKPLKLIQIISGTKVPGGIDNFKITLIIMGKEGGNVYNIEEEDFPPIGTKRIIVAKSKVEKINDIN